MIIEGKNSVREALKSDTTIEKLIVASDNNDNSIKELISLAKSKKATVIYQDRAIMDKTSLSKKHQGVMCITTEFKYCELNDIINNAREKNEEPFILLLDGVNDPHNLGSIIRSAECAGAHGIIIPKHRAVGVNETVIKISEGAAAHMLIHRVTNINDTIRELKDMFINVIAADMGGALVYNTSLKEAIALIVGGEDTGVKRLTRDLADRVVSVPLKGKVNSLNASNAAAVMMYEVVRQRG